MTGTTALAEARRRDVDRRRQRVHQALAEMRAQAAEITISSAAARARVHRSFIHRHPDLRAAVIAAAEDPATSGPAGAAAVSRRSLLADNANLRERSRRLEQHARSLEDRLSELLGTQISQRTGLGPPPDVAALKRPGPGPPAGEPRPAPPTPRNATRNSPPPGKPTGG